MDFGEFLEFLQFLRGRRTNKENSEVEDKEDIECLDRFIQKIKPIVEETLLEIKTYDKMGFDRPWWWFMIMTNFTIIFFHYSDLLGVESLYVNPSEKFQQ